MKYHPYTELFPLLEDDAFEELKANIATNGLRMDVITYQGQLLDGRNRERACEAAGVPCRYAEAGVADDREALDLVVSLNKIRRHLTLAELAFAAEKLATLRHGSNQFRNKEDTSLEVSSRTTSKSLTESSAAIGVSRISAERARAIRNHGTEQDVSDVLAGKTTLSAKARELSAKARKNKPTKPAKPSGGRVITLVNRGPIPTLTRQQVDPEFNGTATEWKDKYGHVQIMNAEQYATDRFNGWATNIRALRTRWKELPELGRAVDHNWLRSPSPRDVARLEEALEILRPVIAEAEALLITAKAAVTKKDVGQPDEAAMEKPA